MAERNPQRISSMNRASRAPSWGGRLGSIPDTDDGEEEELEDEEETMDFSDAASGGEESSGGGSGGGGSGVGGNTKLPPPPPRRSSLPTLAEDSVGGGSRSTRTRSPSPSFGTIAGGGGAGGGSRTASGVEEGSGGGRQQQQQQPSSSGERGGVGVVRGVAGGNAPTPPPPPCFYGGGGARGAAAFPLFPLSHSGRWDSYFDSKRKVNVPGRGKFCVYQRGGVAPTTVNYNNSGASSGGGGSAFANADAAAAGGADTALSPAPPKPSPSPSPQLPVVFCHHGAGYTGLSWALMASQLGPGIRVVAYDARGHGETETADDGDLSAATQAEDAAALWRTLFAEEIARGSPPKTVAVGHAMGGMACVRAAAEHNGYRAEVFNPSNPRNPSSPSTLGGLVGIALIDVVLWHGGAAESAPHMMSVIAGRPPCFDSHSSAMLYATASGRCRNPEAVAVSFASMVREVTDERGTHWEWRTPLEPSKPHWEGWYRDLASGCLLSPKLNGIAKLLMFSAAGRSLDRSLEVARAQGKLQVLELPLAAFAVHEDEPGSVAGALREFLEYNCREKGEMGGGSGGGGNGGGGNFNEASSSGGSRTHLADGS